MLPTIELPAVDTGPFRFSDGGSDRIPRPAPPYWREWLQTLFPRTFTAPFADHHVEFWEWVESIEADRAPDPAAFASILPRSGGKTTNAETAVIRLAAREARNFVLYVRATQDKANESITNIAAKLESAAVELHYPDLASRKLGKYGYSKGWRMDLFRCASGFSGMALGLDAAARGVKLEDVRPDLIVFDDIDSIGDSPRTIKKKVDIITKTILPAGAPHLAVLVIQNVMHESGIVASLVDGTAEFLYDIHISGPHPAVRNLTYEPRENGLRPSVPSEPALSPSKGKPRRWRGFRITGGEPTWAGQDLTVCEAQINKWGLTAFLNEAQHEVEESGGVWDHVVFRHVDYGDLPDFIEGQVWCDPAVTATDESDANGIAAGGIDTAGNIYVTYGWEAVDSPLNVIKRAVLKALDLGYGTVGVETDQGGDTWKSVYARAWRQIVEEDEPGHIISVEAAEERELVDPDRLKALLRDDPPDAFMFRDGEWEPIKRPKFASAKAGAGHGSKTERNQRMLTDYELGRVLHLAGAHTAAEKALRRFPNKPLDLADALYWLWFALRKRRKKSRIY